MALLAVSAIGTAQAQEFAISDGGTQISDNCQNTLVLTDSNADNGNYLPGENYEITMCINTIAGTPVQFAILPNSGDGTGVWDVDGDSELFIYEGDNTGAPTIGVFNTETDPNGVFFTTTSTCLTFVFTSGASSSGAGFVANINCIQELQPFNAIVNVQDPHSLLEDTIEGLEGKNVITFCFNDTLSFIAAPTFPLSDATGNGYEQLTEECTFIWDMGDGTVVEGLGLTEFEHVYTEPGGYFARLRIIDVNGRMERFEVYLLMAPRVLFSNNVFEDTLCIGDTTQITGGILGPDTVGVGPNTSTVNLNLNFTDSIAIPDGSGVDYFTEIDIFGYSGDPVINDPEDFIEVCMNIEHSYLGDLQAWLICPDNTEVLLFDGFLGPAANQFLGDAVDNSLGIPGVGFDYCFNDDAVWGTLMEELVGGNLVPVTMGNAMDAGTYQPEEDFSGLVGCPVNGLWRMRIRDNLAIDDGFIFSWGLEFNPEFTVDTIRYSPDVVDAYWLDNPDIVVNNDTIITVVPSSEGGNAFTFVAEDSFGCLHDTTYIVYVRPDVITTDDIACDLTPKTARWSSTTRNSGFPKLQSMNTAYTSF
ncbi:MAG: PKD domain-containing protein [Flavobacteriales bacterium]|nr:PKD domain-containing protein [Flavobacteriales bacterium]